MAFKRKFSGSGGGGKRRRTGVPKFRKYLKKYAAKKRNVRPKVRVQMGMGFPKQIMVTHKYVQSFTMTSTIGAMTSTRFTANGMFDPDITGTGHQPMYFDQYSAIYDHYCVIGSRIVVKAVNTVAGTSAAGRLTILVNDDTSITTSNVETIAEQNQGLSVRIIPAGYNDKPVTMMAKFSAKKFFGGSTLANTELQGTTASNPTEQTYYDICMQADGGSSLVMAFTVEIQYIAIWKELKDIAPS